MTNDAAWLFLSNLAPSYRRDSIWRVMSAKKQETRPKRLGILIGSSKARLKTPSIHEKTSHHPPMRALKPIS
ncbi:MAG: YdeI/OmpD-associated family protein [Rhodobacteraceae bacterium]|nr:YdeI/OmpD-associated family protein [Paracoccaceae bacterium]